MVAPAGPFADQFVEGGSGLGLSLFVEGEAEVFFVAKLFVAMEGRDDEHNGRSGGSFALGDGFHAGGEFVDDVADLVGVGRFDSPHLFDDLVVPGFGSGLAETAVDEDETGVVAELGAEDAEADGDHGVDDVVALTDDKEVGAALALEADLGGAFDGVGRSDEDGGGLGFARAAGDEFGDFGIAGDVAGGVAFEDDLAHAGLAGGASAVPDFLEVADAFFFLEPDDLEGRVGLDGSGAVVVDTFAGPGKESGRGIGVVHDEVGVGLVTGKGDADGHLAKGGAGKGEGSAKGLGTEDGMDAKGPALPDDAIEEDGGLLGDLVVFGKELLKLVDEEKGARHGNGALCFPVAGDILHAGGTEEFAAVFELFVKAVEDTEAELAVALDGDDAGMGKLGVGVAFELDAFFEVDEVELDFVGIGPEGEVGNEDVEEGRFTGTGLTSDEGVLAGAFAEGELLELRRAAAPDGNGELGGGIGGPHFLLVGSDEREGYLDAVGVAVGLPYPMHPGGELVRRGWLQELELCPGDGIVFEEEAVDITPNTDTSAAEVVHFKSGRKLGAHVAVDEEKDSASGAGGGDALETLGGEVGEAFGEIGDDDEVVSLGNGAGGFVVLGDGLVVATEIHLDHFFHVIAEFAEAGLDLVFLRADAGVDEDFFVVGKVHEPGEALAKADGIDEGKGQSTGGRIGEPGEGEVVEELDGFVTTELLCLDKDGGGVGNAQSQGQGVLGRIGELHAIGLREGQLLGGAGKGDTAVANGLGKGVGGGPLVGACLEPLDCGGVGGCLFLKRGVGGDDGFFPLVDEGAELAVELFDHPSLGGLGVAGKGVEAFFAFLFDLGDVAIEPATDGIEAGAFGSGEAIFERSGAGLDVFGTAVFFASGGGFFFLRGGGESFVEFGFGFLEFAFDLLVAELVGMLDPLAELEPGFAGFEEGVVVVGGKGEGFHPCDEKENADKDGEPNGTTNGDGIADGGDVDKAEKKWESPTDGEDEENLESEWEAVEPGDEGISEMLFQSLAEVTVHLFEPIGRDAFGGGFAEIFESADQLGAKGVKAVEGFDGFFFQRGEAFLPLVRFGEALVVEGVVLGEVGLACFPGLHEFALEDGAALALGVLDLGDDSVADVDLGFVDAELALGEDLFDAGFLFVGSVAQLGDGLGVFLFDEFLPLDEALAEVGVLELAGSLDSFFPLGKRSQAVGHSLKEVDRFGSGYRLMFHNLCGVSGAFCRGRPWRSRRCPWRRTWVACRCCRIRGFSGRASGPGSPATFSTIRGRAPSFVLCCDSGSFVLITLLEYTHRGFSPTRREKTKRWPCRNRGGDGAFRLCGLRSRRWNRNFAATRKRRGVCPPARGSPGVFC